MKLKELLESNVVQASFGKKNGVEQDTGIEIPKGYDRFELDHKDGESSSWIVGIKGDKKTRISRAQLVLAKELVKAYNNGGKSDVGLKPISMTRAFGSSDLADLHDAGIKLTEKPDGWSDFENDGYAAKRNIHEITLKKAEKVLGKKFKVYSGKEIFGSDFKPKGPLANAKLPTEPMFIVAFNDGSKYLADVSGAKSYIKNWQKIV